MASRLVTLVLSRPHHGRSPQRRAPTGGQLIIKRVVEKVMSSGPMNYPILMKSNYNQWSLLMKIKLEAHSLWGAVKLGGSKFQLD
jgi:hypothetical protein